MAAWGLRVGAELENRILYCCFERPTPGLAGRHLSKGNRSHTALYLLQWCLPGFLRNAELTAAGWSLRVRGGLSTLQVAPLQFLWVTPSARSTGRRQRGVSTLLPTRWGGPWGWWVPKIDAAFVQLLLLHQQRVAAGSGTEPASRGGARGGAGAEGAGASVTISKRIQ